LRGDVSLSERLVNAGFGAADVRMDTGAVRVALTAERDQAYWVARLSAQVAAHRARSSEGAAPAARAPATSRLAGVGASADRADAAGIADTSHSLPIDRLLAELDVAMPFDAERGLTAADARERLARDGANQIEDVTGRSAGEILLSQVKSVPAALLGGSAALALATRAYPEAGAIGAVLAANATLGFVSERQAQATVSSLRLTGRSSTTPAAAR
jgi:Ca2+-transporting ATPase